MPEVPFSCQTQRSSNFVVDVTSLSHVDNIKKDDFGRWDHKGSHPVPLILCMVYGRWLGRCGTVPGWMCRRRQCGNLRRLYCTHPSNRDEKLLAFVTSKLRQFYATTLGGWCLALDEGGVGCM